jgi:hypothetical protein
MSNPGFLLPLVLQRLLFVLYKGIVKLGVLLNDLSYTALLRLNAVAMWHICNYKYQSKTFQSLKFIDRCKQELLLCVTADSE